MLHSILIVKWRLGRGMLYHGGHVLAAVAEGV
jgi:hypothetical protein